MTAAGGVAAAAAQAEEAAGAAADPAPVALRRSHLLAVYAAAPLLMLAAVLDLWLADGGLRRALPASPWALPGYALVLGLPHIVASFFAFADAGLAHACRPVLQRAAWQAALAAACVAPFLGQAWAEGVVVAATMVHVMGQQTGLAVGMLRLPPQGPLRHAAAAWRLLLALSGAAAGLALGGEGARDIVAQPAHWMLAAGLALGMATPLAAWLGWRAFAPGTGAQPRALLAMHGTTAVGLGLAVAGYPLLGIALLRVVHDTTAFLIYGTLANEREQVAPGRNRLYRLLGLAGRRPGVWLWPVAIVLVVAAVPWLPPAVVLWLVFLHYAAEHHLWRRGSPLRDGLRLG
ncbi:hypothetical protein [Ideonella sp.]|uniref:hypothetical protein n=1 Tax=Ideonella sp. TaxID=1929293 RepID=UPI0035AE5B8C